MVLPNGTNLLGVARHTPRHGFLPGLAHVTLCSSVRRPGGTWLRELRPPTIPLPPAAIGRPLSRMPVIIRSHESSPASMVEDVGRGMEFVLQFVQDVDIERNYFQKPGFFPSLWLSLTCHDAQDRSLCTGIQKRYALNPRLQKLNTHVKRAGRFNPRRYLQTRARAFP